MAVKVDLSYAKEYAINTHNDVFHQGLNIIESTKVMNLMLFKYFICQFLYFLRVLQCKMMNGSKFYPQGLILITHKMSVSQCTC